MNKALRVAALASLLAMFATPAADDCLIRCFASRLPFLGCAVGEAIIAGRALVRASGSRPRLPFDVCGLRLDGVSLDAVRPFCRRSRLVMACCRSKLPGD